MRRPVLISLEVDVDDAKKRIQATQNDLFKLKADHRIERLNRIGRIIQAERDNPTVAIDVNQSWGTTEEANNNVARLEFKPDWIEQPVAASDKEGLKRVQGTVMADESFYTQADYLKFRNRVEMFNIKLAKMGGLSKSCFLAQMCTEDNKRYVVGSMIESPVGTMAGYHLAKAWEPIWLETGSQFIRGVDDPLDMVAGTVRADDAPGLGVKPTDLEEYYPFSE